MTMHTHKGYTHTERKHMVSNALHTIACDVVLLFKVHDIRHAIAPTILDTHT